MSQPMEPEVDDAELLRRHAAGDRDAFDLLVRRHRDRLWAIALRTLGDPEEAADALQDALISAFRRAGSFRGDSKVTTWLHRIVVNACLDRVRRRQVRATEPLPDEEDRMGRLGVVEDDSAELAERRAVILTALRQLTPDQRTAIVLVDLEGYSVEEAALLLECAPGTVKSRCSRGRAKLLPLLGHLRDRPSAPRADSGNLPAHRRVPSEPGADPGCPSQIIDRTRGGASA